MLIVVKKVVTHTKTNKSTQTQLMCEKCCQIFCVRSIILYLVIIRTVSEMTQSAVRKRNKTTVGIRTILSTFRIWKFWTKVGQTRNYYYVYVYLYVRIQTPKAPNHLSLFHFCRYVKLWSHWFH